MLLTVDKVKDIFCHEFMIEDKIGKKPAKSRSISNCLKAPKNKEIGR